jgi:tetratricopeptide (TPR) repeat protein
MSKATFVLSAALAVSGVAGVAAALVVPATAAAAAAEQKVGPVVGKYLKTAQDAIQKRKWDQALAAIKQAQGVDTKTAFEQYKINELLWYVYLQQGRNLDAARLLEQQMNSGMMPANEKAARTKTLAQLYFRGDNFGKAIQYANQYLKSSPRDADMQLLVAQSYYQQKDYKDAIAAADRIIKAGGRPSEDVLQLMLRSSYEVGDQAGSARALELMLKYYPTPETWQRMLDGYIASTKHDDELLALYRLAEDVGALTKARQYTDMSQGLIVAGFAIEGERIIQQGLDAGVFQGEELGRAQRTLATARRRADAERQQLPKAAATLAAATTGPQMLAVGRLYFSAADYANASAAIAKALAANKLEDPDSATMLLGIAYARQNKSADAEKAFKGIQDPKMADVARLWMIKVR